MPPQAVHSSITTVSKSFSAILPPHLGQHIQCAALDAVAAACWRLASAAARSLASASCSCFLKVASSWLYPVGSVMVQFPRKASKGSTG